MDEDRQAGAGGAGDAAEVPSEVTQDPTDVLAAFGEGRANAHDVMRALVSHRGWLVPLGFLAECRGDGARADSILILSHEAQVPPGNLWLFTDEEAALLAQSKGAMLGAYASGMSGTELFGAVGSQYQTVYVNPGSPPARTWLFQEGSATDVGSLWAAAVALEESFAGWQATGEPDLRALEGYRAFTVYNHASGPVITLPGRGGMSNPAVAFTAPDCAEAFLKLLSEEQRAQMRPAMSDGKSLLGDTLRGIDGLLFNPFGPGATYALPLHTGEDSQ
ncbi:MAG: hypothetical protein ACJ74T_09705 [Pyrinomonadaceae bacterium]